MEDVGFTQRRRFAPRYQSWIASRCRNVGLNRNLRTRENSELRIMDFLGFVCGVH